MYFIFSVISLILFLLKITETFDIQVAIILKFSAVLHSLHIGCLMLVSFNIRASF